jgi:hypothetical protein
MGTKRTTRDPATAARLQRQGEQKKHTPSFDIFHNDLQVKIVFESAAPQPNILQNISSKIKDICGLEHIDSF